MAFIHKLVPPVGTLAQCNAFLPSASVICCVTSTSLPFSSSSTSDVSTRHRRQFHSSSPPQSFKFKIKIKDPDENQQVTPFDYDSIDAPGFSTPSRGSRLQDDAEDNLYHRNIRRKMAFHVDPKTKQRTMQSWPLVTMSLNALKDTDIPTGIKFNVAYHDTHAHDRHSGPIVLLLHGLQLPSTNFAPMVKPLLDQGFRVVAPIFPTIGHNIFKPNPLALTTAKDLPLFSHSTIERGIFINDFVSALLPRGRKIDVVVAADAASYPAIWLGCNGDFAGSFLFLDGFPATPLPVMKPLFLFQTMARVWESRMYWPLALPFLALLTSRQRSFGSMSYKEAAAHLRYVAFADFPLIDGGLTTIEMRSTPAVVYASKKSRLVPDKDAREFIRRLGIRDKFVEELDLPSLTAQSSPSLSSSTSSSSSTTTSPSSLSDPSSSSTISPSPLSPSPSNSSLSSPLTSTIDRSLTHSCARLYEPRVEDPFENYNRRYAKADWFHLTRPIVNDIINLAKRVSVLNAAS